jgi:hypothetical protein
MEEPTMVRIGKHRAKAPRLQHWQHKANIMAHIQHIKLWLTEAKAEMLDAWNTYKTK